MTTTLDETKTIAKRVSTTAESSECSSPTQPIVRRLRLDGYEDNLAQVTVDGVKEVITLAVTPLVPRERIPACLGSLKTLALLGRFDQALEPGMLPESIEELYIGGWFDRAIPVGALPPRLTRIWFQCRFNQPIGPGTFPVSLKELYLGDYFNQELEKGALPAGLEHLELGKSYTKTIKFGVVPAGVTGFSRPIELPPHEASAGPEEEGRASGLGGPSSEKI